jgi:hypothetical protein
VGTPSSCGNNGHGKGGVISDQPKKRKKGADFWGEKTLKYQRRGLITQKKKGLDFRGKLLHKLQYNATKVGS